MDDDYTDYDALLEADETKNDTPIIICRSYQDALIEEITSINFVLVLEDNPYSEEHDAVYECLTLVEDCERKKEDVKKKK